MQSANGQEGLHLFVDGSYAPDAGQGGWAFVGYRNGVEIASRAGGLRAPGNNAMELASLLEALLWIDDHARDEPVVLWSDSVHAVKGCNDWRPIWKNNGWTRIGANARARRRKIANLALWQAIDQALCRNALVTVAWCKGHSGIGGNERADGLAAGGRLSMGSGKG